MCASTPPSDLSQARVKVYPYKLLFLVMNKLLFMVNFCSWFIHRRSFVTSLVVFNRI